MIQKVVDILTETSQKVLAQLQGTSKMVLEELTTSAQNVDTQKVMEAMLESNEKVAATLLKSNEEVIVDTNSLIAASLLKYRAFVRTLYRLTAGGPPVQDLIKAIEDGEVNEDAIGCLLGGFPFDSYTEQPTYFADA